MLNFDLIFRFRDQFTTLVVVSPINVVTNPPCICSPIGLQFNESPERQKSKEEEEEDPHGQDGNDPRPD